VHIWQPGAPIRQRRRSVLGCRNYRLSSNEFNEFKESEMAYGFTVFCKIICGQFKDFGYILNLAAWW